MALALPGPSCRSGPTIAGRHADRDAPAGRSAARLPPGPDRLREGLQVRCAPRSRPATDTLLRTIPVQPWQTAAVRHRRVGLGLGEWHDGQLALRPARRSRYSGDTATSQTGPAIRVAVTTYVAWREARVARARRRRRGSAARRSAPLARRRPSSSSTVVPPGSSSRIEDLDPAGSRPPRDRRPAGRRSARKGGASATASTSRRTSASPTSTTTVPSASDDEPRLVAGELRRRPVATTSHSRWRWMPWMPTSPQCGPGSCGSGHPQPSAARSDCSISSIGTGSGSAAWARRRGSCTTLSRRARSAARACR